MQFQEFKFLSENVLAGKYQFCLSSCKQKCIILCWARKAALIEHEFYHLKQLMRQGEVQCGVEGPFPMLVLVGQRLWLTRVNEMLPVSCRVWGHQDKVKDFDEARLSTGLTTA